MRLISRYTAILVGLFLLVLMEFARERVTRDRLVAEDQMWRTHQVLGSVMRARADDIADSPRATRRMQHTMEVADRAENGPRFEWLDEDEAATLAGDSHRIEGDTLVSVFPVNTKGRTTGAIRIREPLAPQREQLRHQIWFVLTRMAFLTLLSGVLSLVVGRWLVAKPVGILITKARRTGRSDFSEPLRLKRTDEVGALAAEIDAMCEALAVGREKLLEETTRRIAANDELRHAERLATAGKLAAGVAHELGTPLSIISGRAQMIASGEVSGDKAQKSAAAIEREANRIGRIVRQLLDFVRKKGPDGEPSSVADVVARTLALLEPVAAKRGVRVETEVDGTDHRVAVDQESLQQVVTNLAANALDAMPTGGSLILTTRVVNVAPHRQPEAPPRDFVRLDVRDTGAGIPESVLDHIFEPFFTTKPPGEGTGLGLSVAYGIVEDHDGWIRVETSPKGTTVSVLLPRLV